MSKRYNSKDEQDISQGQDFTNTSRAIDTSMDVVSKRHMMIITILLEYIERWSGRPETCPLKHRDIVEVSRDLRRIYEYDHDILLALLNRNKRNND